MAKISYHGGHFEKRKYLKLRKGEISTSYRMLLQGPQGYMICREKTITGTFCSSVKCPVWLPDYKKEFLSFNNKTILLRHLSCSSVFLILA